MPEEENKSRKTESLIYVKPPTAPSESQEAPSESQEATSRSKGPNAGVTQLQDLQKRLDDGPKTFTTHSTFETTKPHATEEDQTKKKTQNTEAMEKITDLKSVMNMQIKKARAHLTDKKDKKNKEQHKKTLHLLDILEEYWGDITNGIEEKTGKALEQDLQTLKKITGLVIAFNTYGAPLASSLFLNTKNKSFADDLQEKSVEAINKALDAIDARSNAMKASRSLRTVFFKKKTYRARLAYGVKANLNIYIFRSELGDALTSLAEKKVVSKPTLVTQKSKGASAAPLTRPAPQPPARQAPQVPPRPVTKPQPPKRPKRPATRPQRPAPEPAPAPAAAAAAADAKTNLQPAPPPPEGVAAFIKRKKNKKPYNQKEDELTLYSKRFNLRR